MEHSEDIESVKNIKLVGFKVAIFAYVFFLVHYLYRSNKLNELHKLFSSKEFIINIVIIIIYTIYVFKFNSVGMVDGNSKQKAYILDRLKDATKKAAFGFIIALLAYVDVTIAAFWIIFIIAFYFDGFI